MESGVNSTLFIYIDKKEVITKMSRPFIENEETYWDYLLNYSNNDTEEDDK